MALYNRDSKLSEAIMAHPNLIPVVNRIGIRLGVGDGTIGVVCARCGICSDFFLSVINTFLDEEYFPSDAACTFSLEKTVDYLRKTNNFYLRVQLPNIDRHFGSLIERSRGDNNLHLLRKFYQDMRSQLTDCLSYDENILFPALTGETVDYSAPNPGNPDPVSTASNPGSASSNQDSSKPGYPESDAASSNPGYSEVEEKLHDLLFFFVEHLKGEYDLNLCTAVVTAVFSLEQDICQNNRIRNRILLPLIETLKKR